MATNSQPRSTPNLVEKLFRDAFDRPRDPRSAEYKAGARAVLTYRVKGVRVRCPYQVGTAQSDAYYAGVNEGHHIWRAHVEAEQSRQAPGKPTPEVR